MGLQPRGMKRPRGRRGSGMAWRGDMMSSRTIFQGGRARTRVEESIFINTDLFGSDHYLILKKTLIICFYNFKMFKRIKDV